ncbi:MAG: hypothetical protein PHQ52_02045 [Candidatus Omnitrophica bacterium]|nr:hypothetical protein [Candidatus Omnitrophota bacterium]
MHFFLPFITVLFLLKIKYIFCIRRHPMGCLSLFRLKSKKLDISTFILECNSGKLRLWGNIVIFAFFYFFYLYANITNIGGCYV